jgi:hypothetical protein
MKKTIGLAALMFTAVAAFAQPAAAYERFNNRNDGRKEVVVIQHDNRARDSRDERNVRYVPERPPVQYVRNCR